MYIRFSFFGVLRIWKFLITKTVIMLSVLKILMIWDHVLIPVFFKKSDSVFFRSLKISYHSKKLKSQNSQKSGLYFIGRLHCLDITWLLLFSFGVSAFLVYSVFHGMGLTGMGGGFDQRDLTLFYECCARWFHVLNYLLRPSPISLMCKSHAMMQGAALALMHLWWPMVQVHVMHPCSHMAGDWMAEVDEPWLASCCVLAAGCLLPTCWMTNWLAGLALFWLERASEIQTLKLRQPATWI